MIDLINFLGLIYENNDSVMQIKLFYKFKKKEKEKKKAY